MTRDKSILDQFNRAAGRIMTDDEAQMLRQSDLNLSFQAAQMTNMRIDAPIVYPRMNAVVDLGADPSPVSRYQRGVDCPVCEEALKFWSDNGVRGVYCRPCGKIWVTSCQPLSEVAAEIARQTWRTGLRVAVYVTAFVAGCALWFYGSRLLR